MEFTTIDVSDALMPPELLDQIPPEQEIVSVTADGAFDTRKCHDAIAAQSETAITLRRKNPKLWKADTARAIDRNENLRSSRHIVPAIW